MSWYMIYLSIAFTFNFSFPFFWPSVAGRSQYKATDGQVKVTGDSSSVFCTAVEEVSPATPCCSLPQRPCGDYAVAFEAAQGPLKGLEGLND